MTDAPTILLRRTSHGLEAIDAVDHERVCEIALGSEVEVTFKRKRSSQQNRLYWQTLGRIVKATDRFPTSEILHDEIKMALGYSEKRVSFDGRIYYRAKSSAFQEMDSTEFKVFFDRAMELLAKEFGFDPLAFYQERKAA